MNSDTFFEKWRHDILMLEDAYIAIQHKKSSKLWLPICFCVMAFATVVIILFLYDSFQIRFEYLILYALFGFYQIFMSMRKEYLGVCDNELLAYNTIDLLHSLSPEMAHEYDAFCTYHNIQYFPRLEYIVTTKTLLEEYYKKK